MATPTPSKSHHHHQEMTPGTFANHLAAFSPLPAASRSVGQSPAYLSRKSPANAAALQLQHTGSSNPGGALNFDSPSAAALGLNLNMPGLDSVTSTNVRADEEERRRRIETILATLRTRPGRVSEEGVERLARRTGLECLWEDGPDGVRTLSIAGSGILIDVDFKSNSVTRVTLSFPTSPPSLAEGAPRAAEILKRQLTPVDGSSPVNTDLTAFTAHLERLARLDKLSSQPHLNCFEAISGIYTSLKRVFEWEKGRIAPARSNDESDREVLCKKSGRPTMHAGEQVGLSLEYWMDRRLVLSKPNAKPSAVKSSQEQAMQREEDPDADEQKPGLWAAVIECEASPAELYTSVRVSNDWVSGKVGKPPEDTEDPFQSSSPSTSANPTIDWLDPPATVLSQDDSAMTVDSGPPALPKLPNVRFVARLHPPVVVPLSTAYDIYNAAGIQIPQESLRATTFDGLLLGRPETSDGETRDVKAERTLLAFDAEGNPCERAHRYSLHVPKQEYGRVIEDIPFAHPRQLVAVLPILRQYALLANILSRTFLPSTPVSLTTPSPPTTSTTQPQPPSSSPQGPSLDTLLATPPPSPSLYSSKSRDPTRAETPNTPFPIDVTLSTSPTPRLTLVFSRGHPATLATATFEIGPQGGVTVLESDLGLGGEGDEQQRGGDGMDMDEPEGGGKGKGREVSAEKLSRALEVVEDVGVWVEWVRRRLG